MLRFYTWEPPAVSLGRFQDAAQVDAEYAARRGWGLVRRPTGGRGVLHQYELTYAILLPPEVVEGVGVRTSYRVLTGLLEAGLRELLAGVQVERPVEPPTPAHVRREPNCFALPQECDALVAGGKLVGSAQARRNGALLQHGSILLDAEPEAWEALFGTSGQMITLCDLLGYRPAPEVVTGALLRGLRVAGLTVEEAPMPGPD